MKIGELRRKLKQYPDETEFIVEIAYEENIVGSNPISSVNIIVEDLNIPLNATGPRHDTQT